MLLFCSKLRSISELAVIRYSSMAINYSQWLIPRCSVKLSHTLMAPCCPFTHQICHLGRALLELQNATLVVAGLRVDIVELGQEHVP